MFHHIFLACEEENGDTFRTSGHGDGQFADTMDGQIRLCANCSDWRGRSCFGNWHWRMAGRRDRCSQNFPLSLRLLLPPRLLLSAEAPAVAKSPDVAVSTIEAEAPVVARAPVERRSPAPESESEPKAKTQLAALDPYVRLPDESDQPASKGYIMYANSPVYWTPVPLPDDINSDRVPHNNIRAEIEQAAALFNVDVQMMKAFARIESRLQSESQDRQVQVPVPAFRLGICQILAWRHLRHPRLLDRGGKKVCH